MSKQNGNGNATDYVVPAGYLQLGSQQAPYVKKAPGVIVQGELMGRFLRKDAEKRKNQGSPYLYQVRLSRRVLCTTGSVKKGTQEDIWVEAGDLVSLDEITSLKDLKQLTDRIETKGERFNVFIIIKDKVDLDGGNTFWNADKHFMPISVNEGDVPDIEGDAPDA